jgi:hypothetical protein
MTNHAMLTRLPEYINAALPDLHGHQRKAITDFVFALLVCQSGVQAALARCFDNFEAAAKRLSRLLHNERISVEATTIAHARAIVSRLPHTGLIRLAIDWTVEDGKHLLVISLLVGFRAVPLLWAGYAASALKNNTHRFERELVELLVEQVLPAAARARVLMTADRGFGDVEMLDLLERLGISYVIRAKGNVCVGSGGRWQRLSTLRFRTNQRRRQLGRLEYCQSAPRRVWLTHARERDRSGRWGVWYLISNRPYSAVVATREYARRFGCEQGFRDAKRLLGFAEAKIASVEAWVRMLLLVALALVMLVGIGQALLRDPGRLRALLRRVTSRRRDGCDLSLQRAVTELLSHDRSLWWLLSPDAILSLNATL